MDVQKTEHGRTEKRIFCIRTGGKVLARNAERNSKKGRKRVLRKVEK
jgi:hypothetical protein